jgi:hypothetical protein
VSCAIVILASTCAVSDRRRSPYLRPIRTRSISAQGVTPPFVEVVCDVRLEHATLSANTPTINRGTAPCSLVFAGDERDSQVVLGRACARMFHLRVSTHSAQAPFGPGARAAQPSSDSTQCVSVRVRRTRTSGLHLAMHHTQGVVNEVDSSPVRAFARSPLRRRQIREIARTQTTHSAYRASIGSAVAISRSLLKR